MNLKRLGVGVAAGGAAVSRYFNSGKSAKVHYPGIKSKIVNKSRYGNSYTKTKRKNKPSALKAGGHAETEKHNRLVYKKTKQSKLMRMLLNESVWIHRTTNNFFVNTSVGTQMVGTVTRLYDRADINSCYTSADAFYNRTAGAVVSSSFSQPPGYQSQKLLLKTGYAETRFSNAGGADAELELFWCLSKVTKVTFTAPDADWETGINYQELNNGAQSNSNLFARPTTTKLFNINWKIVKNYKVKIGSGAEHTDKFAFKPNRAIDMVYSTEYETIRGVTMALMVIAKGAVVCTGGTHGVIGTISTASVKVPIVTFTQYTSGLGIQFPRAVNYTTGTFGTGADTTYRVVEDGDDAHAITDLTEQA